MAKSNKKNMCFVVLCYAPDGSISIHLVTRDYNRAYDVAENVQSHLGGSYRVRVTSSYCEF